MHNVITYIGGYTVNENIVIKQSSKEDSKALKWMSLACSKDKARYILNGFLVNQDKTAAADGYRLHIINTTEAMKDSLSCRDKVIKPLSTIGATPKIEEFEIIDGRFPTYQEIIPSDDPVFTIGINKKYLAALATMPGDEMITLEFTDPMHPVKITSSDGAVAVIMPMKPNK